MSSWRAQGQLLLWLTRADRQTWHLLRMDDTRIPNLAYEYTSTGRRNVDRQRKRQKDQHPWRRNEPGLAYNLLLLLLLLLLMMTVMIIIPALYLWGNRQHARTHIVHTAYYVHTQAPGPMLRRLKAPRLRQSIADLLPQRTVFSSRPVLTRSGAVEVSVGQILPRILGTPLSVSFHHCFFCDGTQRHLHWGENTSYLLF
jgi:hypothetical protein